MTTPTIHDVALTGPLTTPAGILTVVASEDGTIRAAGFGSADALVARFLLTAPRTDLRPVGGGDLPTTLVEAVQRYADGDPGALDTVPVVQPGGAFFQTVWEAMRRIPPGTTQSYTALAGAAGRPTAVRAAGSACARNLVAPFVPCHRVVRTDGTLGGYAYGVDAKRALLAHERARVG